MKGVLFTFDAFFALLIVAATTPLVIFFTSVPFETVSSPVASQAESAIYSFTEISVKNVIREPVIMDLYSEGVITETDLEKPVIDIIAAMWASNSTENLTRSRNITEKLLREILPDNLAFSLSLENDTIFDTGGAVQKVAVTGRRVASGFMKGEQSTGFISSVFLTSIGGRKASSYYFFGGFVGQGNITTFIDDIPQNATIKEIFMEISIGSNFTFHVNNAYCGIFNNTMDPLEIRINGTCISNIIPGTQNMFNFTFMDKNITNNFIGGGFLRVTYTTNQLLPLVSNTTKIKFPGIDGIINYFGSIFVPGNITSMEMRIHVLNNFTTLAYIGNTLVLNSSGGTTEQTSIVDNENLSALLNYSNISSTTVPIRLSVSVPNLTLEEGSADVILITDTSGSMNWELDSTSLGVERACNDPLINYTSTRRLSYAKCLDKDFIDIILNTRGNRVALVSYSYSASNTSLSDNKTYLSSIVDGYTAGGATCVCCAERAARQILEDQSNETRDKFVIVMTDGIANMRCYQPDEDRTSCCTRFYCRWPACGIDLDYVPSCGDYKDDVAITNAIDDSCKINTRTNATVHSIGFGPVSSCDVSNNTLQSIANCGNGSYFASDNTTELKNIYTSLAEEILLQTFKNQTTLILGNVPSYLFSDSYIEVNFTPQESSAFQEIATDVETNKFSSCNFTFFVPEQLSIENIAVTSFSGDLWTSKASVKSNKTSGSWQDVYSLVSYGSSFRDLGDPFVVNMPPALFQSGDNNSVSVYLGTSSLKPTEACPPDSRIIYRARFGASVPSGSVFPKLMGGIARVYYDIDHNGVSDGFTDIIVGGGLPEFNSTVRTTEQMNGTDNSLDDAFVRLMDVMNFVVTANNTGVSGSPTNPIDIEMSDVAVDATTTSGIPFAWGPIDIRLVVKV